MCIIHVSDKVGADDLFMRGHRRFMKASDRTDPYIADPDIDGAGKGSSPRRQRPHSLRVGDISGHRDGIPRSQRAALLRHSLQGSGAASGEHNRRSGTCECFGGRLTNTARSAGDNDRFVCELTGHDASWRSVASL